MLTKEYKQTFTDTKKATTATISTFNKEMLLTPESKADIAMKVTNISTKKTVPDPVKL